MGHIGIHTSVTEKVPQHHVVKIEIDSLEKVKTSEVKKIQTHTGISELAAEKQKQASGVGDYVVKVERDDSYTFEKGNDSSVEKLIEVDHCESHTPIEADCGINYIYDTDSRNDCSLRTFGGNDHTDGQEEQEPLTAKNDDEWNSQLESYLTRKANASSIEECDSKTCSDIKEHIEGIEGKYRDTGCEHFTRKDEPRKSTLIEQFDKRSLTDMNQPIDDIGDLACSGLDEQLESYLRRKKLSSKCVSIEKCDTGRCTFINQSTDDTKGTYSDVILKEPRTKELVILDCGMNDSICNDDQVIHALTEAKQEEIADQLVDTQTDQHCRPGGSGECVGRSDSVAKKGECTDPNRYFLRNKRKLRSQHNMQSQLKRAKVKGNSLLQMQPMDFTEDNRTDACSSGRLTGYATMAN